MSAPGFSEIPYISRLVLMDGCSLDFLLIWIPIWGSLDWRSLKVDSELFLHKLMQLVLLGVTTVLLLLFLKMISYLHPISGSRLLWLVTSLSKVITLLGSIQSWLRIDSRRSFCLACGAITDESSTTTTRMQCLTCHPKACKLLIFMCFRVHILDIQICPTDRRVLNRIIVEADYGIRVQMFSMYG